MKGNEIMETYNKAFNHDKTFTHVMKKNHKINHLKNRYTHFLMEKNAQLKLLSIYKHSKASVKSNALLSGGVQRTIIKETIDRDNFVMGDTNKQLAKMSTSY